jgi:hypothetical protein
VSTVHICWTHRQSQFNPSRRRSLLRRVGVKISPLWVTKIRRKVALKRVFRLHGGHLSPVGASAVIVVRPLRVFSQLLARTRRRSCSDLLRWQLGWPQHRKYLMGRNRAKDAGRRDNTHCIFIVPLRASGTCIIKRQTRSTAPVLVQIRSRVLYPNCIYTYTLASPAR